MPALIHVHKGSFVLRSTQTGSEGAKHAIVVIYDIFGFWETTKRGSDILATRLGLNTPTQIFMPDIFRGKPFPKDKDGDKEELSKFFAGTAKIEDRLPEVLEFGKYLKEKGFKKVSILGYCYGGKITLLALQSKNPFCCGAIVHPAMITNEDGDKLAAPLGFYPSADEPEDAVKYISEANKEKFGDESDFKLYDTVHHGWAAARANLRDEENLKQFQDVYQRLAEFFAKEH
ncbi:dienelactone hydrolase [Naematelia encephala]|uniref:Dienelactone hydrolase n=1 Tax=Naematelia encephala TaxID=71784 RepID=A0A1Y2BLY9_9TREE|nr:dienelactone hydrolase [Naematelia encephala]